MKTKKHMPLATEGNYTEPSLGELICGNELTLVNEQHTVEDTSKREMPEEQLAALKK